jgi:capsule synthesis protein PGA_cap
MKSVPLGDFVLIEAKTISENVPSGLPALQIVKRQVISPAVSLCAVGDIGLSGRTAVTAEKEGGEALFAEVAPFLRSSDISFGNLESPLIVENHSTQIFAAPLMGAGLLRKAGFSVIHLANNHVGEYGQGGLSSTIEVVGANDMIPLGAGSDLVKAKQLIRTDSKGLGIGWLGCGRTLLPQSQEGPRYWEFNEDELLNSVKSSRTKVDVLIVSIHIGFMYLDYPSPAHKTMAEKLMCAGADLILMHHAHILQGVQIASGKSVCCYNLGNFLYDWQEGNVKTLEMEREQTESAIFYMHLDQQGIASMVAIPTWIDECCRVRWATGARGDRILKRLSRISQDLKGDYAIAFESQRASRNTSPILKVLSFHIRHGNWGYVFSSLRKVRGEHIKMLIGWIFNFLKRSSK